MSDRWGWPDSIQTAVWGRNTLIDLRLFLEQRLLDAGIGLADLLNEALR